METDVIERDALLAEMVRRLVDGFQPDFIYLFGSRATGEATEDSDYDLMVVVPRSDVSFRERWVKAFRLLCGVGVPKDVIVLTRDEFNRKRTVACSLPATVVREGKLLYAKNPRLFYNGTR